MDRGKIIRNFVTFVLFVVINFLTTKDAKHTKEEAPIDGLRVVSIVEPQRPPPVRAGKL